MLGSFDLIEEVINSVFGETNNHFQLEYSLILHFFQFSSSDLQSATLTSSSMLPSSTFLPKEATSEPFNLNLIGHSSARSRVRRRLQPALLLQRHCHMLGLRPRLKVQHSPSHRLQVKRQSLHPLRRSFPRFDKHSIALQLLFHLYFLIHPRHHHRQI